MDIDPSIDIHNPDRVVGGGAYAVGVTLFDDPGSVAGQPPQPGVGAPTIEMAGVDGPMAGFGQDERTGRDRVEVRRSARRSRTVSARREGDTIVVMIPARMSKAQERRTVEEMVTRIRNRELQLRTAGARAGDSELARRARQLSRAHLDGRAVPVSVRWVDNMTHRWGSCTMLDRTIRLSRRLADMPDWVVDYVLVHELAHLLEPGHGPRFWEWVSRYPRAERARGYLEGISAAANLQIDPDDPDY